MRKPNLYDAIHALVGGQLSGSNTYNSYIYHDGQTPPTEEAIQTKLASMISDWEAQEYARYRQAEYPPWNEQLVKIFHDGVAKWKSEMVQPVKDKYPKPE